MHLLRFVHVSRTLSSHCVLFIIRLDRNLFLEKNELLLFVARFVNVLYDVFRPAVNMVDESDPLPFLPRKLRRRTMATVSNPAQRHSAAYECNFLNYV